jgi:MoaA/NifB/PqqE/SkfB family radical SAM enzyme
MKKTMEKTMAFAAEKAIFSLRDIRNLVLRELKVLKLSTLILALTDKCNLKCAICDIWEKNERESKELDFNSLRQILGQEVLKRLKHIYLTGGEPFMRADLCEIVLMIKGFYPRSGITISSNGTLTGQILDFLHSTRKFPDIGLEFSLLGVKTHDVISGVKGSFENLENTIYEVRKMFPSLILKAKFVITPRNYIAIEEAADYCQKRNIPLMFKIVENVESYTNSLNYVKNLRDSSFFINAEQAKSIINTLNKIKYNPLVNRLSLEYLVDLLDGKSAGKRCFVPFVSLFINSKGDIYRCRMREPIGNINETPFNFITAKNQFIENKAGDNSQACRQCASLLRFLM